MNEIEIIYMGSEDIEGDYFLARYTDVDGDLCEISITVPYEESEVVDDRAAEARVYKELVRQFTGKVKEAAEEMQNTTFIFPDGEKLIVKDHQLL